MLPGLPGLPGGGLPKIPGSGLPFPRNGGNLDLDLEEVALVVSAARNYEEVKKELKKLKSKEEQIEYLKKQYEELKDKDPENALKILEWIAQIAASI